MCKLWATTITEHYVSVLCNLGPLAYFEGLLSLYGSENDMWSDMQVAVEDLSTVNFTLVRSNNANNTFSSAMPHIVGSRQSLTVLIPVPDYVYSLLPPSNGQTLNRDLVSFKVTPVFFNIGINEMATLSESLGYTKEQHRSNWDNFDRLKQYQIRYKKILYVKANSADATAASTTQFIKPTQSQVNSDELVGNMLNNMEELLKINSSKNIKILHVVEDICRAVNGLRFTSCKSAKDRTAMAVTLEQFKLLQQDFHLPPQNAQNVLDTIRR